MSTPQQPATEGTAADHARSGADLAEGITKAERGSAVAQGHGDPGSAAGTAPAEQATGDPEMTEGQVVRGEGERDGGSDPSAGKDPREAGSGGAQSQPGPRASDKESAGQPRPQGPPFTG